MKRFFIALILTITTLVLLAAVAGGLILSTLNLNDYRTEITQAASKTFGRPVVLEGNITHNLFPLGLAVESVIIRDDLTYGSEPFLSLGGVSLKADLWKLLTGALEIDKVELRTVALKLAVSATGEKNWQLGKQQSALREGVEALQDERQKTPTRAGDEPGNLPLSFTVHAVSIDSCRVMYADLREKTTLHADLGQVNLAAVGLNRHIPFTLRGKIELAGDKRTSEFALQGSTRITQNGDLDLTLDKLEASLANPEAGNTTVHASLSAGLLYTHSMNNLAINDLKGRLESTDFTGTFALILPGGDNLARGRDIDLRGEIAFGTLDVDNLSASLKMLQPVRYKQRTSLSDEDLIIPVVTPGRTPHLSQGNATAGPAQQNQEKQPQNSGQEPLFAPLEADSTPTHDDTIKSPVAFLHKVTTEIDVKANSVTSGKIHLEDVQGTFRADGGKVDVPFIFRTLGGRANGTLRADAASVPLAWHLQADMLQVDAEKFVGTFSNSRPIAGKFSAHCDLSGKGLEWPGTAPSMQGKAGLSVTNGKVHKIIPKDIAEAVGLPEDIPVERVSASFLLKNGVAETRDISAISPLAVATGKGKVDLTKDSMLLEIHVLPGGKGPAIPLVVSGPLKNPATSVDGAKAAKIISQQLGKSGLLDTLPGGSKETIQEVGKGLGKALDGLLR